MLYSLCFEAIYIVKSYIAVLLAIPVKSKVVMIDRDLVPGGSFPDKLSCIYEMLKGFCEKTSTPLHMDSLSRNLLNFQRDSDYPCGCHGLLEHHFFVVRWAQTWGFNICWLCL